MRLKVWIEYSQLSLVLFITGLVVFHYCKEDNVLCYFLIEFYYASFKIQDPPFISISQFPHQ